jgi:hypothetical protein
MEVKNMKRNIFISIIIVSLCLAMLMPALSFSQEKLRKEGRYYIADIEKTYDVKKGGDLVMEKIRGDVVITTWDKNVVQIHEIRKMDVYTEAEAKAVLKESDVLYQKTDNTIKVGGEDSYRSYMSSKFEVVLPVEFNVDIGTSGGDISVTELTGKVDLKTSGGDIDLVRIDGIVTAKTSGGDVTVSENKQSVAIKTSGGDVKISDVMGAVDAVTSGGDISVENNRAKVSVKTSGGDIELKNIGAEVDAHTSGGDITVDGTNGALEVSTSGGDIDLKNIKDVINAKTSGGDIEAMNVLNGIYAATSGGDVDLNDIQGFVEAKTSGGDVEAKITLKDFSKDHHVNMKSSGGSLILYIPEKLPATITAVINIRGASWQDYDISSDFPLTSKKESEEAKSGRREEVIRSEGKINGGGDLIFLETTNGNISINKLK